MIGFGGDISLHIDPLDGGRITGLVALGREWLAPSRPREVCESFVDAGTGGWDEVAPTVEACSPETGIVLRDHGDAWRSPWRVLTHTSRKLEMSVELPSAAVTLRRTILSQPHGVRFEYEATTRCARSIPLLWCAHPLFDASSGARIVADGDLTQEYPIRGKPMSWPRSVRRGTAVKAFASGVAAASVVQPDGAELRMSWDVPHVGFYWDDGKFSEGPVIAIEPSTGGSDSAVRAKDQLPSVSRDTPLRWWLALDV